ncbi:hypothetical protein L211DRAFT_139500 [Terfezia boudieri ATCC MYA-4762]|uniref:Uncharacterized protein n=1 Tax=Terfezia boudieri ATCC MYA-4762 TaxID=1051890 RepID=A0A3N4LQF2_9PEZI|nr:hypothetical protein L211DRAFT_139500 [Terfezia boudieri ATCC MYA-4762]
MADILLPFQLAISIYPFLYPIPIIQALVSFLTTLLPKPGARVSKLFRVAIVRWSLLQVPPTFKINPSTFTITIISGPQIYTPGWGFCCLGAVEAISQHFFMDIAAFPVALFLK